MARNSSAIRRRLLTLAKATVGVSVTGATGFWFWTRKCSFEEFEPETDALFSHPILSKINPWNKPESHDMCVRRVAVGEIRPELLEDAREGGSRLVEAFCAGMWGRYGFGIQRRIMTLFKDEGNKEDLWTKDDLLGSTYEPGTFMTHHFHILEKRPQSIVFRACFSPRQTPPSPLAMDTLCELRAEVNEEKHVVEFRMKAITFNGLKDAPEKPDPFGGVGGWLHRQYAVLLLEAAAENCMR